MCSFALASIIRTDVWVVKGEILAGWIRFRDGRWRGGQWGAPERGSSNQQRFVTSFTQAVEHSLAVVNPEVQSNLFLVSTSSYTKSPKPISQSYHDCSTNAIKIMPITFPTIADIPYQST